MKSLFFLLSISCVTALGMASCSSPSSPTQYPRSVATAANKAQETFVQSYFELFNQHRWEELSALYADSAFFKDPALGKEAVQLSHADFIGKYRELESMFPNVHDEVKAVYPSANDHVVVEFVSSGDAADGTHFEMPICTIFRLSNGKIISDYTYYDNF